MHKIKSIILSTIFTILLGLLLGINYYYEETPETPNNLYQVYLDGEKIGIINSKDELYNLINEEQAEIKDEYKVNQVYPPKGFQIIRKSTYDENLSTARDVYDYIKDKKTFTIKGYTITIKSDDEEEPTKYIYVLDRAVFEEAIKNLAKTFVTEDRYEQYIEGTQSEISDTGYIIERMLFEEEVSIKESYISVDEKIYTDVAELTKYLLFGENNDIKEYTVVQGDTIEKIAENNKLNTSELLLANQNIKSVDTLLAIGQKLNVSLINPVLTFIYEEYIVEDIEQQFQTEYKEDNTKYTDYSKTIQEGVNGISRISSRAQFINGEENQQRTDVKTEQVIRNVKNRVIVKGTKKRQSSSPITGKPLDLGGEWYWPTNHPYVITSRFQWRWGSFHEGIDISGTGYKSPIYAALDGVVIQAGYGGIAGNASGCNVIIQHDNGYYTLYGHMATIYSKSRERSYKRYSSSECDMIVKVGQRVKRGQQIGKMGKTGTATGVHVHFGLFNGRPYYGGKAINPMRLWQ